MNGAPSPRLIVTIGTDHHPFDRLMQWIDALIDSGAISPDQALVQAGFTRPPRRPPVRASLPRDELLALMTHADVVVGHGGPGTIMDARSVGRRPIVVPRLASRGEVVDDHQVSFARRLAALDKVVLAEDYADLVAAIRRGLADPAWLTVQRTELLTTGASEVARRIDRVIGDLPAMPRPRISRRIGELWRAQRAARDQAAASLSQPKSRSR